MEKGQPVKVRLTAASNVDEVVIELDGVLSETEPEPVVDARWEFLIYVDEPGRIDIESQNTRAQR